jgi:hypothetical protein
MPLLKRVARAVYDRVSVKNKGTDQRLLSAIWPVVEFLEQRQMLSVTPVAEWNLAEGTGSNVADTSANGENGIIHGRGYGWTTSSTGTGALSLGTKGAYVTAADADLPSGNDARTLSLSFNTTELADAHAGSYPLVNWR